VGIGLAVISGHGAAATSAGAPGKAAAQAIAYAQRQLGKPYLWGGTGPYAFDCSGLTLMAYRAAGIGIARTSQEQWATEQRVTSPDAGDLVFFAGADGTPAAPGHVGLVIDPARHLMIDAYTPGTAVRVESYGASGSAPGLADPAGFTDPAAHAGAA
jgi:peptidoglycan DL-endopeptidase CwlO